MKRRDEVLVGLMLTVAIVVGILGTIWLARGGLGSSYPLYARFKWGAGLKMGQPVELAGVQIGYVANVDLIQDGTLGVTMRVQDDFKVPEGSTATVIPVGIFGDMAIALNPELGPVRRFIASGDTVPTGRGSPTTAELLERVDSISRTVTTMTDAIQVELVKNGGVADLHRTILQTNQLIGQLGVIAAEQSRQLSTTQQTFRRSLAAVDSSRVDSTVKNLEATSANIERLTRDLGQTSTRLNSVLAKLDSTSGSAGALLNDPGLYRDMRGLVTRLDSLTLDFQKNPRRYINLRVF